MSARLKLKKIHNLLNGALKLVSQAEEPSEINRKNAVIQRWFERCMEARAENVKLKRALWLARAKRAKERQRMLPNNKEFYTWQDIERRCFKKAEKYK